MPWPCRASGSCIEFEIGSIHKEHVQGLCYAHGAWGSLSSLNCDLCGVAPAMLQATAFFLASSSGLSHSFLVILYAHFDQEEEEFLARELVRYHEGLALPCWAFACAGNSSYCESWSARASCEASSRGITNADINFGDLSKHYYLIS